MCGLCRYLKNYCEIMLNEKRTQNILCREHMSFWYQSGEMSLFNSQPLWFRWGWPYSRDEHVIQGQPVRILWLPSRGDCFQYRLEHMLSSESTSLCWLLGNKCFLCVVITSSNNNENLELLLIIFENEANTENMLAKRWRKKRDQYQMMFLNSWTYLIWVIFFHFWKGPD